MFLISGFVWKLDTSYELGAVLCHCYRITPIINSHCRFVLSLFQGVSCLQEVWDPKTREALFLALRKRLSMTGKPCLLLKLVGLP